MVNRVVKQDLEDFSQKILPTVSTCSTIDLTLTPLVPLEVMHSTLITFIIVPEDAEDAEDEEDVHIQQDTTPSLEIVLKDGKDNIISNIKFNSIDDAVSSGKALAKLTFVPQPDTSYHLCYNYYKGEYDQSLVLTDFHVEALVHGHRLAEVFNVFGGLGSGSSGIEWKQGEMILQDGNLSREVKKMILNFSYSLSDYKIIDGTVLHCAVVGASKNMVDLITEYIGMEACDRGGQTLLHTASACGNVQMAKALIDSYVRNEGHRYTKYTAGLEEAFLSRHVDKKGLSVMHYASHYGQINVVNFLYEVMGQGAFSLRNHVGETPLILASRSGHMNVARFCVDFGGQESIELTDNEGVTALLSVIDTENNNYDVIKLLIDSGVDTNAVDNTGDSAMHNACWRGRLEVVKLLYEVMGQGAFSLQSDDGSTPLTLASYRGHINVAQFCVDFGGQE